MTTRETADSATPWEPPTAGTEAEHLLGALDRQRTTFRWKADGLDAAGLSTSIGASSLTLGALLKHLALVEAYYFRLKLCGESPGVPWETVDWDSEPDYPFTSAADDSPEALYRLYDNAVATSRTNLAAAIAGLSVISGLLASAFIGGASGPCVVLAASCFFALTLLVPQAS